MRMGSMLRAAVAAAIMAVGVAACGQSGAPGDPAAAARLQRLEDLEAIRALLVAYGRTFDARDFEAYAALFATDAVWSGAGGSFTGPDAIREMVESGYPPSVFTNSFHIMSSFDIEITGADSAAAWSRWTFVVENEDGQPAPFRAGRYEDELVRVDGQWKFKQRRVMAGTNR